MSDAPREDRRRSAGDVAPDRWTQLFAPLRYTDRPWALPAAERARHAAGPRATLGRLAVAALVLGFVALGRLTTMRTAEGEGPSVYRVATLSGSGTYVADGERPWRRVRERALARGDRLATPAGTRARLTVGAIGAVELDPETTVHVREGRERVEAGAYVLYLARGTVHATIDAGARVFQVDTPSGVAVDLGCRYTAQVAEDGTTLLVVTGGQVAFEHAESGRRSYVPAGARVRAYPGRGPGLPTWSDAGPEMLRAVARLDADGPLDEEALAVLLTARSPRTSLTTFHLLRRSTGTTRERLFDHLAEIVPPPPGLVTRAGCLAGDERMLATWEEILRAFRWSADRAPGRDE